MTQSTISDKLRNFNHDTESVTQFLRCLKTKIRKVCRICLNNLTNLATVIIVGDRTEVSWHWHALVSQAKESWSGSKRKTCRGGRNYFNIRLDQTQGFDPRILTIGSSKCTGDDKKSDSQHFENWWQSPAERVWQLESSCLCWSSGRRGRTRLEIWILEFNSKTFYEQRRVCNERKTISLWQLHMYILLNWNLTSCFISHWQYQVSKVAGLHF